MFSFYMFCTFDLCCNVLEASAGQKKPSTRTDKKEEDIARCALCISHTGACSNMYVRLHLPIYFRSFSPPARWGLLDFMSVASSSSCLVLLLLLSSSSSSSNCDPRSTVFSAGPQPRPSTPSVPCRTSTTTIHAQCSLPDLNREYPRQVFPAGPHVGRYIR